MIEQLELSGVVEEGLHAADQRVLRRVVTRGTVLVASVEGRCKLCLEFVDAATALGSRSWQPIVAMAEHAIRSGDRATAAAVFHAADQPGFHQRLLVDRQASLGIN